MSFIIVFGGANCLYMTDNMFILLSVIENFKEDNRRKRAINFICRKDITHYTCVLSVCVMEKHKNHCHRYHDKRNANISQEKVFREKFIKRKFKSRAISVVEKFV